MTNIHIFIQIIYIFGKREMIACTQRTPMARKPSTVSSRTYYRKLNFFFLIRIQETELHHEKYQKMELEGDEDERKKEKKYTRYIDLLR